MVRKSSQRHLTGVHVTAGEGGLAVRLLRRLVVCNRSRYGLQTNLAPDLGESSATWGKRVGGESVMATTPARGRSVPRRPLHHDPLAVRNARENIGLSQRALAVKLGISRSHMCEIEAGSRNATPAVLLAISRALRCPVRTLKAALT